MGGTCSGGKDYNRKRGGGKFENPDSDSLGKIDRTVTMKDHEVITAKLNIHKERIEKKINGLSKKETTLKQQALNLKATGNLEGAYYKVKVQKEVKMAKRKMYGMLTVIEN